MKGGNEEMFQQKRIWIVAFAVVLLCGFSGKALAGLLGTDEVETEKTTVKFYREVEKGGYKVVATEELKSWMEQKKPLLIVDTMPLEDSFKKQHIPGAVQFEFPIEEVTQLEGKTREEFEKLLGPDKNRLLVFYCGFTKCTRSHNAAMWAVKLGYTNVYRCPGGIKAWMQADYPIAKAQ
jgi:thiosulfate/3-mercaptopyruvate sulfurtransferase